MSNVRLHFPFRLVGFRLVILRQVFMHYTAWRKGAPKKVLRKQKAKTAPSTSNKFYSTVWLSDYESEPDKKIELIISRGTTPSGSQMNTPYSSQPTSPLGSQFSSPFDSRSNTPSLFSKFEDEDSGLHSENDKSYEEVIGPKKKLHWTLSLPAAGLNQLRAEELHERFTILQLEQENRELKNLTVELQEALEKLEERVNCLQSVENDSLGEAETYPSTHYTISQYLCRDYENISQPDSLPRVLKKRSKSDIDLSTNRRNKKDNTTCCVS